MLEGLNIELEVDFSEESLEKLAGTLNEVFTQALAGNKLAKSLENVNKQLTKLSTVDFDKFITAINTSNAAVDEFHKKLSKKVTLEADVKSLNSKDIQAATKNVINSLTGANNTIEKIVETANNATKGVSKHGEFLSNLGLDDKKLIDYHNQLKDVKATIDSLSKGGKPSFIIQEDLAKAEKTLKRLSSINFTETFSPKALAVFKKFSQGTDNANLYETFQKGSSEAKKQVDELIEKITILKSLTKRVSGADNKGTAAFTGLQEMLNSPVKAFMDKVSKQLAAYSKQTPVKLSLDASVENIKLDTKAIQNNLNKYLFNLKNIDISPKLSGKIDIKDFTVNTSNLQAELNKTFYHINVKPKGGELSKELAKVQPVPISLNTYNKGVEILDPNRNKELVNQTIDLLNDSAGKSEKVLKAGIARGISEGVHAGLEKLPSSIEKASINAASNIKEGMKKELVDIEGYLKNLPAHINSKDAYAGFTKLQDYSTDGVTYKIKEEFRKVTPELQDILSQAFSVDASNAVSKTFMDIPKALEKGTHEELSKMNKKIITEIFGEDIQSKGALKGRELGLSFASQMTETIKSGSSGVKTHIGKLLQKSVTDGIDFNFIGKQLSQLPFTVLNDANIGSLMKKSGKNEISELVTGLQKAFGAMSNFEKIKFDTNTLRNYLTEIGGVLKTFYQFDIKGKLVEGLRAAKDPAKQLAEALKGVSVSGLNMNQAQALTKYKDGLLSIPDQYGSKGYKDKAAALYKEHIQTNNLHDKWKEIVAAQKNANEQQLKIKNSTHEMAQILQNVIALETTFASVLSKITDKSFQSPLPGRETDSLARALVQISNYSKEIENLQTKLANGTIGNREYISQLENMAKSFGATSTKLQTSIMSKRMRRDYADDVYIPLRKNVENILSDIQNRIAHTIKNAPSQMVQGLTESTGKTTLFMEQLKYVEGILTNIKNVDSFTGLSKKIDMSKASVNTLNQAIKHIQGLYTNTSLFAPNSKDIVAQEAIKGTLKSIEADLHKQLLIKKDVISKLKVENSLEKELAKLKEIQTKADLANQKAGGLTGRAELGSLKEVYGLYNRGYDSATQLLAVAKEVTGQSQKDKEILKEIISLRGQLFDKMKSNAQRQGVLRNLDVEFGLKDAIAISEKYHLKMQNEFAQIGDLGGTERQRALQKYISHAATYKTTLERLIDANDKNYGAEYRKSDAYRHVSSELTRVTSAINKYNAEVLRNNQLAILSNKKYTSIASGAKALAKEVSYALTPLGMLNNGIKMLSHSFGSFFMYQRMFRSITSSISKMINITGEYEDQLLRVRGVTQSSSGNMALSMKSYYNTIDKMLQSSPIRKDEAIKTLYSLATSNISSAKSQQMLPDVQNFLIAVKSSLKGGGDAEKMLQTFVKTYQVFRKEIHEVNTALNATQYVGATLFAGYQRGNMTADQMAQGLKKAAAETRNANISLAEYVGTIAYFNNQGVDSSRSGTVFRTMLGVTSQKFKELSKTFPEFEKVWQNYGKKGDNSYFKSLIRALGELKENYKQTEIEGVEFASKISKLFRIRAKTGEEAIMTNYSELLQTIKEIENSSGNWKAIMDQVDARTNSIKGQMNIMSNVWEQIQREFLAGIMGHDEMIEGFKAVNELLISIRDNAFKAGNIIREVGIGLVHLFSFQLKYQTAQFFSGTIRTASDMLLKGSGKLVGQFAPLISFALTEGLSQAIFGSGFLDSLDGMREQLTKVKGAFSIGSRSVEMGFVEDIAFEYERINEIRNKGKRIDEEGAEKYKKQLRDIEKILIRLAPVNTGLFKSKDFMLSGLIEKKPKEVLDAIDAYYKAQIDAVDEKGDLAKSKMLATNKSTMKDILDGLIRDASKEYNAVHNQLKSLFSQQDMFFKTGIIKIDESDFNNNDNLKRLIQTNFEIDTGVIAKTISDSFKTSIKASDLSGQEIIMNLLRPKSTSNKDFEFVANEIATPFSITFHKVISEAASQNDYFKDFFSNFMASYRSLLKSGFGNGEIAYALTKEINKELKKAPIEIDGKSLSFQLNVDDVSNAVSAIADATSKSQYISFNALTENVKTYIDDISLDLKGLIDLTDTQRLALEKLKLDKKAAADNLGNAYGLKTISYPDYQKGLSAIAKNYTDELYQLLLKQNDFFDKFSNSIDKSGLAEKLKLEIERLKEIKSYVDNIFAKMPQMQAFDLFKNAKYDLSKMFKGELQLASPELMAEQQLKAIDEKQRLINLKYKESNKELTNINDLFQAIVDRSGRQLKNLDKTVVKDQALMDLLKQQNEIQAKLSKIKPEDKGFQELSTQLKEVEDRLYSDNYMLGKFFETLKKYENTEGISLLKFQGQSFDPDIIESEIRRLKTNVNNGLEGASKEFANYFREVVSFLEQINAYNKNIDLTKLQSEYSDVTKTVSTLKNSIIELSKTSHDLFGEKFVIGANNSLRIKGEWNGIAQAIQDSDSELTKLNNTQLNLVSSFTSLKDSPVLNRFANLKTLIGGFDKQLSNIVGPVPFKDIKMLDGMKQELARIQTSIQDQLGPVSISISELSREQQAKFVDIASAMGINASDHLSKSFKDGLDQSELFTFWKQLLNDGNLNDFLIKLETELPEHFNLIRESLLSLRETNVWNAFLTDANKLSSEMKKFDTSFTTLTIAGRKLSKTNPFVNMAKSSKGVFRDIAWGIDVIDGATKSIRAMKDGWTDFSGLFKSGTTGGLEGLITGLGGVANMATGVLGLFTTIFNFFDDKNEDAKNSLSSLNRIAEESYKQFSQPRVTADYGMSHNITNQNYINTELKFLIPDDEASKRAAEAIAPFLDEYGNITLTQEGGN